MNSLTNRSVQIVLSIACCWSVATDTRAQDSAHHTFRYVNEYGSAMTFRAMQFSPDSSQLAISIGGKTDFIDTQLGRVTGQYGLTPFSIAYSQDGNRIYLLSEYRSVLLDTVTAAEVKAETERTPGYIGIDLALQSGKLIVKSVNADGPAGKAGVVKGAELIGMAEGRNGQLQRLTGTSVAEAIKKLAGSAGTFVQLQLLNPGVVHDEDAKLITLRRLAVEAAPGGKSRFKELAAETGTENLAWCMTDGKHEFREASSGKIVARLDAVDIHNIGQYAISPDQKKFAIVSRMEKGKAKNGVEVFDIATQDRIAFVPMTTDSYSDLAFAYDNNRVLVATYEGVEVIDVKQQKIISRLTLGWTPPEVDDSESGTSSPVTAAVMIAARDDVAWGSSDRSKPDRQLVAELAVSPHGIVATCDRSGKLAMWSLNTGEMLYQLPRKLEDCVTTMQFSGNGRWFAYLDEGVLHVLDVSVTGRKALASVQRAPAAPVEKKLTTAAAEKTDQFAELVPGLEPSPTPDAPSKVAAWKKEDRVEISSRGRWYPGVIVKADSKGRWIVHYDDSPDEWNEIAEASRIRARP